MSYDQMSDFRRTVLFVNGPPGAGKDTFAHHFQGWLSDYGVTASIFVLSDAIKNLAHRRLGLDPGLPPRAFEEAKDRPHPAFNGFTPRQTYIEVANELRRRRGPRAFANALLPDMLACAEDGLVIVPGVGFADEIAPIIEAFGVEACILLRFSGEFTDSRSRLSIEGAVTIDTEPYSQTLTFDFGALTDRMVERGFPVVREQACENLGLA